MVSLFFFKLCLPCHNWRGWPGGKAGGRDPKFAVGFGSANAAADSLRQKWVCFGLAPEMGFLFVDPQAC